MTDLKLVPKQPDDLSQFERKLVKSLKCSGNIFPEADDEIMSFETSFKKEIKSFAANLPDAELILQTGKIDKHWTLQNEVVESVKDNLAQAAREGKELTDELKRKMIDDRNNSRNK